MAESRQVSSHSELRKSIYIFINYEVEAVIGSGLRLLDYTVGYSNVDILPHAA